MPTNKKALALAFITALLLSATVMLPHGSLVSADSASNSPSTLSASNSASVAPSITWNRTYGGSDWDSAQSVIQTTDGGFLLAGGAMSYGAAGNDFWLVKVDSLGNTQWNKTYGGSGSGLGQCVLQTSDGGYAIAGQSGGSFWLVKTDDAGNMQWNRTYKGTGSSLAYSIIQTSDGGYALAGYTNFVPSSGGEVWLVKTDALGNIQWNRTLGGGQVLSVVQTSDGGYALAGDVGNLPDFLLVKTNSSGDMEWRRTYGSADEDVGFSVFQTSDGGYALGGWMWLRSNGGGPNIAFIKTDPTGNIQWTQTYGAGDAWSMTKTNDGGFAIVGTKLVKTDAAGSQQWALSFEEDNSTTYHQAYSIIQTRDGGFAIAGIAKNEGSSSDAWLAKINFESINPTAQPSPTPSPSPSSTIPTSNSTPSTSPSNSSNPSPSIPEVSTWIVLPLAVLASTFFVVLKRKWNSMRPTST